MAVVYRASATAFKEATVTGSDVKPLVPISYLGSGSTASDINAFVTGVINSNIASIPDKGSITIIITGREETS